MSISFIYNTAIPKGAQKKWLFTPMRQLGLSENLMILRNSQSTYHKGEAPPSAYWDNVRLLLETAEEEFIEAQDYLEKALDNIEEVREQL